MGIYRGSGEVREGLVQEILTQIPGEKIIWEAPQKAQQLYFIELLGCNVNLGNIAPTEVIPLEAMRIGLRADTFDNSYHAPAPTVGQHTDEILHDLGLSDPEIAALRATGVI